MKTKTKQILTFYFWSVIFLLPQWTYCKCKSYIDLIFREINLVESYSLSKNIMLISRKIWWNTNTNKTVSRNLWNEFVKSIRSNALVWKSIWRIFCQKIAILFLMIWFHEKKKLTMPWPQHVNSIFFMNFRNFFFYKHDECFLRSILIFWPHPIRLRSSR